MDRYHFVRTWSLSLGIHDDDAEIQVIAFFPSFGVDKVFLITFFDNLQLFWSEIVRISFHGMSILRQTGIGLPFVDYQLNIKPFTKTVGPTGEPKANLGKGLGLVTFSFEYFVSEVLP